MRMFRQLLIISTLIFLICSCRKNEPVNKIDDLNGLTSEISIKNWVLIGPFNVDTAKTNVLDFNYLNIIGSSEEDFDIQQFVNLEDDNSLGITKRRVDQTKDYFDFDTLYNNEPDICSYSACIINSAVEQDVVFLSGSSVKMKMWVNDILFTNCNQSRALQRNSDMNVINLRKGNNFVLIKTYILDRKDEWSFYLNISSVSYARKYFLNINRNNFIPGPLVNESDSLKLEVNPFFIFAKNSPSVQIFDCNDEIVYSQNLKPGNSWGIPLKPLLTGSYRCVLKTDLDTLEQKFIYGNYHDLFNSLEKQTFKFFKDDFYRINFETLYKRYHHLDSVGNKLGFDRILKRKISIALFELNKASNLINSGQEAFSHISGLHLRGYRSEIDGDIENYMLYIPNTYNPQHKLPVVIIMPWVGGIRFPFIKSVHVAEITRIEYLSRLAELYGFGILWPNSRIYTKYNLSPVSNRSTLDVLKEVERTYNIDNNRIYLYGSCSGGMAALLLANRYPTYFSAIGIEAPELGYTRLDGDDSGYPEKWVEKNSIMNFVENYRNIPVYIYQSRNDHKSDFKTSQDLTDGIVKTHGEAIIDEMGAPTRTKLVCMFPSDDIMVSIFDFYKLQKRQVPDTVMISTAQLKYNKAYWITINGLIDEKKASVTAILKENNLIEIEASNVAGLTVSLNDLAKIDRNKKITVKVNGEVAFEQEANLDSISLILHKSNDLHEFIKSNATEGPVNDMFNGPFMLVKGTTGTKEEQASIDSCADNFIKVWSADFFTTPIVRNDRDISAKDIANYNLILYGNRKSNLIIDLISKDLPFNIDGDTISINSRVIKNNYLSYVYIHPNPMNKSKYVLMVVSKDVTNLKSIKFNFSFEGYHDYYIFDNRNNENIITDKGYFDHYWK